MTCGGRDKADDRSRSTVPPSWVSSVVCRFGRRPRRRPRRSRGRHATRLASLPSPVRKGLTIEIAQRLKRADWVKGALADCVGPATACSGPSAHSRTVGRTRIDRYRVRCRIERDIIREGRCLQIRDEPIIPAAALGFRILRRQEIVIETEPGRGTGYAEFNAQNDTVVYVARRVVRTSGLQTDTAGNELTDVRPKFVPGAIAPASSARSRWMRAKASPNGPPRGADLLAIERRSPYLLDSISSRRTAPGPPRRV